MKKIILHGISLVVAGSLLLSACRPIPASEQHGPKVLAVETFLADIAQNVAGDRLKIEALIPVGVDPHAFEPTPQDVAKIADSQVLIINGRGFEEWLQRVLDNAGGQHQVIDSSAGLTSRQAREGEIAPGAGEPHDAGDPHFWLDPVSVIQYVQNIRDGLSQADPEGKTIYAANAAAYIGQLKELDQWIAGQVQQIPPERRLMVTNHESLGYFADRYGFKIIGTIVPSVSSSASPSAQQMAQLIDHIRASGAQAIFLETGANPQLADQIAQETGVKVVTGLHTHSITAPGGEAPTYIDMMKVNVRMIVEALK